MFLELSEVLVCPSCRPAQGLIVLVDEIEERRVREGRLGCPDCELGVPVRSGVIRFDRATPAEAGDPGARGREAGKAPAGEGERPASGTVAGASDDAGGHEAGEPRETKTTELAALLGVHEAGGYLLLGPGLAGLAPGVARLAENAEVMALGEPAGAGGPDVTWAAGIRPEALPVVSRRLGGVALRGGSAASVAEAARVLGPGARLVVLRPSDEAAAAAREAGLEIVAHERRALVAVRPD